MGWSSTPAFALDCDRYDQSSYLGRVLKFIDVTHPRNLLATDDQVAEYKSIIDHFRRTGKAPDGVSDDNLWTARSALESIVHPDNGNLIPLPFRFSAFVPVNLPICVGMLTATTIPSTIFWQWINQSYNVAVNHANRNASNPMSNEQIAKAYCGAVGVSCGLSVGLSQIAQRANLALFRQFVPFIAVASAGAFNVILMRYNELTEGIEIKDEEGTVFGKSQAAGRSALTQVALTRIALPAPILIIPPLIMNALAKANKIPTGRLGRLFVETSVITACLAMAVPLAIGLFPQHGRIDAADVEKDFQGLRDKKGNPVMRFIYNKGL